MPLNTCGSVRARLSVWFSRVSAARKSAGEAESTSMPAAVVLGKPGFARDDVQRRAALGAASVSTSVPSWKSNAASCCLPASFAPGALPVQPAGDHQVQHQPQVAVQPDRDALAQPPQRNNLPSTASQRRGKRA